MAVVGLSRNPEKDSNRVARYLQSKGYRIVPVNPSADEILSEKSYTTLLDLPEDLKSSIDVVDIFRPSEDVPPIVDQAVSLKKHFGKPDTVWMQLGIVNEDAARRARDAGIEVVMDRCMMIEHRRLLHNSL
ncbi:MAG: CoA-binding protein [Nitrososphaerales archaeon]